ncbi:GNAT family N-acetyltransferase [candidate division KSB1 bacterium]|nr:GNAT family N-acetyltransferase [candidate division KSB1 bacterium]
MSIIKILEMEDKKEWLQLYENIPFNDIYLSPSYLATCKHIMEGTPYCFVYFKNPGKYIMYPFFKRRINDLNMFSQLPDEYFDIISPYGYSGFLASSPELDVGDFIKEFDKFCRQEKIVNEFIRLNPLLRNHEYKGINDKLELIKWSETVYIDLDCPLEEIKGRFTSANKRNINKAIKNDLKMVELECNEKNLLEFLNVYIHTMDRLNANSFYYFSKEYFMSLKEELNDKIKLFSVINKSGENMAMGIFFAFNQFLHYHLGGSWMTYWNMRPNNLLFSEVIEWAHLHGYKKLHLGGGYKKNDSLFRFKKSFSPLTMPYFIVKRVHDSKMYNELQRINKQYLNANKIQKIDESYFPAYRLRT